MGSPSDLGQDHCQTGQERWAHPQGRQWQPLDSPLWQALWFWDPVGEEPELVTASVDPRFKLVSHRLRGEGGEGRVSMRAHRNWADKR